MNNPPRWFSLELPDEVVRKMTRQHYYAVRSYLRLVERLVAQELDVMKGGVR